MLRDPLEGAGLAVCPGDHEHERAAAADPEHQTEGHRPERDRHRSTSHDQRGQAEPEMAPDALLVHVKRIVAPHPGDVYGPTPPAPKN